MSFTNAATNLIISGPLITSLATVASSSDVWRMTGALCMGASLGLAWSCLSKQSKEEGRMTKARIIAGSVTGVFIPRMVESIYNWFSPWGTRIKLEEYDPLMLIAIGFLFAIVGFYIAHTILRGVEKEQKKVGDMVTVAVVKTLESKLNPKPEAKDGNNEDSSASPGN